MPVFELKFHMEYSFDCFRSLEQNGCNPHICKNKICFNNKPKLALTYFNIIKEIK